MGVALGLDSVYAHREVSLQRLACLGAELCVWLLGDYVAHVEGVADAQALGEAVGHDDIDGIEVVANVYKLGNLVWQHYKHAVGLNVERAGIDTPLALSATTIHGDR